MGSETVARLLPHGSEQVEVARAEALGKDDPDRERQQERRDDHRKGEEGPARETSTASIA
jgi:hypothetical protein